ncbi:HEAT repeat domain-containing protein [Microcoleus vaginatus]|uniref:HEAT repeat domain-containing protein n=1 Tax=Microcoleus vaginatus TaxID=119532 RepID=UPI0032A2A4B0
MRLSLYAWEFLREFEKQKTIELDDLIQVYREHWRDESWHEVLGLMAGMVDAKFTGEVLEYLIGENGEAEKFSNLFLAAECVSEVKNRNESAAIARNLRERLKELTRYGNITNFTPSEYDNLVYQIHRQAVAAVAETWKDDPETLPILKQRAQSDDDSAVRRAAVQELARGWKDDPETLPILKQRAQSDDDLKVRRAAVQEIARGWKDDPETLPILKQRAQSDDDWNVRYAAVQEIARGWKDDPETLPWLKQRAQSDDDWNVRGAAVQEIARGWKDEPGIFELLCDVSINHPFAREYDLQDNPRQIALTAMIELYPDRPETLELVRDRAQNDSDERLRKFAQKNLAKLEPQ